MLNRSLLYITIFFLLSLLSCNKDDDPDNASRVPNIPTNIFINLNLPSYSALNNPGSYVYVSGGSKGIVVYRVSLDQFAAFDRHCTFQVNEGCQIDVEEATLAEDLDCCNSVFEIINGTPVEGPAVRPLLPYNTQFNPNLNQLRIFN